MTPCLVDSNVIIDIITEDAQFLAWSAKALADVARSGVLFINPIIFAEVSSGFGRREDATAALDALDFECADLSRDAVFIAGKAFIRYRQAGGVRRSPLPEFYIALAPTPWWLA